MHIEHPDPGSVRSTRVLWRLKFPRSLFSKITMKKMTIREQQIFGNLNAWSGPDGSNQLNQLSNNDVLCENALLPDAAF